ncbi:hypothetical protein JNW89_15580 [Micromonospora sp. 4G55]|nr:hypothetical protein [Micromonospora sp. 4G55]
MAAYRWSRICCGVPQPWLGRCWNRPIESRSPPERLRRPDSWYAVASATTTARSGICRWLPIAAMVAAFAIWSASSSTVPSAWTVQVRLATGSRSWPPS